MFPSTFYRRDWGVSDIPLAEAQRLVRLYHYAKGGSNTRTFSHGLFFRGSEECCGVAWWIPPTRAAANAAFPEDWRAVLSLSRLVIVPGVPSNACSFLLSASVKLVREHPRWRCLVTYADDWRGHRGTIYRAANWEYRGKTIPEAVFCDSSGRMVARKAGPHTRTRAEMAELGCTMVGRFAKHRFRLLL